MVVNDANATVQQDRQQWTQWARHLLARDDWVLLDTETTGLDRTAEIVELAVLDHTGKVLCDTVLRPELPIPPAASAIHGLTDADVEDAPTIVELWPTLLPLLTGKRLVAYHVAFDLRVLRQTAGRYGLPFPIHPLTACVMEAYAAFAGRRSPTGHPLRQTLAAACEQLGVPAGTHRAADDCRATLAVLRAMADCNGNVGGDEHLMLPDVQRTLLRAIERAWSEVRRLCKQRSPRVAALLASAHPVAIESIEAGIPPIPSAPSTLPTLVLQADYPFHFQRLCEPVHHRVVVAAVQAVLQQPLRVRVTLAPEQRVFTTSTASAISAAGAWAARHQGARSIRL